MQQLGLVPHQDELALVDHPDAVGHLLGFLDVVSRQNDGHPFAAQTAHELPHVVPQIDVHARRRLVQEQDPRLVRERLGDEQAALHPARQGHDPAVPLFPQRKRLAGHSRCEPAWRATRTGRE